VRSLTSTKLDTLLIDIQQRSVDVLLLCETWHDADSASIRRLRVNSCNVVERAQPPDCSQASLSVNHGAGVSRTAVDVGVQPSTFQCVAARVTSGTLSCVVVVLLYRPGSAAVTATFLPNCQTFWIDFRPASTHLCSSAQLIRTLSSSSSCWRVTGWFSMSRA